MREPEEKTSAPAHLLAVVGSERSTVRSSNAESNSSSTPLPRRDRALVGPQPDACTTRDLFEVSDLRIGEVAGEGPRHPGFHLLGAGIQALALDARNCATETVAGGFTDIGLLLEAQVGQLLPAALTEGLNFLRCVDLGQAHLDLLIRAFLAAPSLEGVAVGDRNDETKQNGSGHSLGVAGQAPDARLKSLAGARQRQKAREQPPPPRTSVERYQKGRRLENFALSYTHLLTIGHNHDIQC